MDQEHNCDSDLKVSDFFQLGSGRGSRVLILGESLAENGWRKSGKAFYTPDGRLLPTGKRLNMLLEKLGLSLEQCCFTELAKCFNLDQSDL